MSNLGIREEAKPLQAGLFGSSPPPDAACLFAEHSKTSRARYVLDDWERCIEQATRDMIPDIDQVLAAAPSA